MSNEKVARPATPCLDVLNELTDRVFAPVGYQKLAAAGQLMRTPEDLMKALSLGVQVNQLTQKAASQMASPVDAHLAKVASLLGGPRAAVENEANEINASIDAEPELSAKMAAALA